METLSLKVGQLHCEGTGSRRMGRARCRTPRLPTPETSTSSLDGSEGAAFESLRYDPARDASMQPRSRTESTHSDAYYHKPASNSRDYREAVSRTPPYHTSDSQRPSLPPLKFVLGDELASPPCTPTIPPATSQPLPREPLCRLDPLRPSSLYPNKRQKTEGHRSIPPLSTVNRFGGHPTSGFTLSPIRSHAAQTTGHAFSRPRTPGDSSPLRLGGTYGPVEPVRSAFPNRYAPAALLSGPAVSNSLQHHEPQQPPPQSARSENAWTGSFAPMEPGARTLQTEHAPLVPERPDAGRYYAGFEHRSQLHAQSISRPYPPPPETSRNGHDGTRQPHSHSDYGPPHYQPDQPPESFVPAPYEYSYPKTRKRSNLPKQSTEIMRAWFDQNIENPYPSEEQKAIFANATGISMTQVSNWFINHRRRCPELRDRRAERRKL